MIRPLLRAGWATALALALAGCATYGNGLIGITAGASRGSYVDIAPDGTRRVVRVGP